MEKNCYKPHNFGLGSAVNFHCPYQPITTIQNGVGTGEKISPYSYFNSSNYLKMLTSSANQYLRPEYLSPLPTTLDAKKSPLALLAQTCNNIGADTPNAKSLIPPLEKSSSNNNSSNNKESSLSSKESSSSSSSHREKSTPHQSEDKSSFKPYESIKKDEPHSDSEKGGGFRTPTSKSCSPAISSTGSINSEKASPHLTDARNNSGSSDSGSSKCSDTNTTSVTSSLTNSTVSASLHSQHNRISIGCGNMFVEVNHHESALPKDHHAGLSAHLPLGYKPGQLIPGLPPSAGLLSSLSNCTGCTQVMGHGIPVDTASVNSPYSQGITTQSGSPLKPSSYPPAGSALSPYVAYARVKTIAGGSTLVPICRDPYCTNCQLSMQNAQQIVGATCPSGCTQCNHEKAAAAAGLGVPGVPHLSSLSLMPGLPGPNTPGSGLYPHSLLTPRPNVCSWVAGDTYCGKRFASSEELLQHVRTHANLAASDSATLSLLSPSLSLSSAPGLSACHLHYSMAPSLTSPAGLHRTYPTSLSPVSSLSASRYHPYKPQLSSLGGAPLSPFPPHPSLGTSPYFSPYAMYAQRLGTAVHP